jgi:hypothetical protein
MTVENDGLPPPEPEATDPPTDLLPLDGAAATRAAAADAAARQAELAAPVTPSPPPGPDTPTHGSLEGDLFDDQADR